MPFKKIIMKSKLSYLNTILTVIAIQLIIIVLKDIDIISSATASDNFLKAPYSLPLNEKGELLVKLPFTVMDVNIQSVCGVACFGSVPVLLED